MPSYRHGPARILVADSISAPIDQWTYMGHSRGGTVQHDVALSFGRVNEFSRVPIAEAVFSAPVSQVARFRIADSEMLKLVQAHPGAVRVASSTKEALTLPASPQAYTSKAVAIIPELEHTDNLFADSANVTYFQDATLRIEEVPAGTDPGESDDAILAYDLVIESLSGAVGRGYPAIGSPSIYPQGVQFLWEPQYDGLVPKVRDSFTFTRGSTGTYVNSAGIVRTAAINEARYDAAGVPVLEPQGTNLCTDSEDFTAAAWATGGGATVVSNNGAAPDESTNGDTITLPGGAGDFVYDTIVYSSTAGQSVTFSVFTNNALSPLAWGGATIAGTDLFGTEQVGLFYRHWLRRTFTSTTSGSLQTMMHGGTDIGATPFVAWGAQLEAGDRLTSYIPTSGASATRSADVWGGAGTFTRASTGTYVKSGVVKHAGTNEPRYQDSGLLLEPQRTNLTPWSQSLDIWGVQGTLTATANTIAAPDGTLTAEELDAVTSAADIVKSSIVVSAGSDVTWSMFVKQGTSPVLNLGVWGSASWQAFATWTFSSESFSAAIGTSQGFEALSDGWYRIWITGPTGGDTASAVYLYPGSSSTGSTYAWGLQFENASYPTSYIPTAGSSVTRSKDNVYFDESNRPSVKVDFTTMIAFESMFGDAEQDSAGSSQMFVMSATNPKIGGQYDTGTPDKWTNEVAGFTVDSSESMMSPATITKGEDTEIHYRSDTDGNLVIEGFEEAVSAGTVTKVWSAIKNGTDEWGDTRIFTGRGMDGFKIRAIVSGLGVLTPAQIRRFLR